MKFSSLLCHVEGHVNKKRYYSKKDISVGGKKKYKKEERKKNKKGNKDGNVVIQAYCFCERS